MIIQENVWKYEIRRSKIHGNGVFSLYNINKKETIGLAGYIDNNAIGEDRIKRTILGRYINHSTKPNSKVILTENNISLVAIKKINKNEEILVNYKQIEKVLKIKIKIPKNNITISKYINEGFFTSSWPSMIEPWVDKVTFDEFYEQLLMKDNDLITWFLSNIKIPNVNQKINIEVLFSAKMKTMYLYSPISPPIEVWNHIAENFGIKKLEVDRYVFVDTKIVIKD